MIIKTKVQQIGDSLTIALPFDAVKALAITVGDDIVLTRQGDALVLRVASPALLDDLDAAEKAGKPYSSVLKKLADK